MSFISGEVLAGMRSGSYENRISMIEEAVQELLDGKIQIIATRDDFAIAIDDKGRFYKANYVESDGVIKSVHVTDHEVELIEDLDKYVAECVHDIVGKVLSGDSSVDTRNRLRCLSRHVNPLSDYFIEAIIPRINDSLDESWVGYYDQDAAGIRSSLKGSIREIEGRVPRTKYSALSPDNLDKVEEELHESIKILSDLMLQIVDSCEKLVFDDREELQAISDSLSGEAKAVGEHLERAERLMLPKDLLTMAEAHDMLAKRAKTMVIVSEYLSRHTNDEEMAK